MLKHPIEAELLLPFEKEALRGDYREFFKAKRNNLRFSIRRFRGLWDAYELLDEIWMKEIGDLTGIREKKQLVPALLFIHAHLKFRLARESGFSCCLAEAWGLIRVGIESVAFAHKMYSDPHLVHVWSDKDGGKAQWRAFKEAFEKDKKNSLYSGCRALTELYEYWGYSSDWGSHTSIAALATRFRQSNSSGEIGWNVDYFEVEESRVAMTLYSILDVSFHMECVFYEVFQQRFKLDPSLVDLRTRFLEMRGALAQSIQKRYGKDVNSRAPGA